MSELKLSEWNINCHVWKIKPEGTKRYKKITLFSSIFMTGGLYYNLEDLNNAHKAAEEACPFITNAKFDCYLEREGLRIIATYRHTNGREYYKTQFKIFDISKIEDKLYITNY